MIPANTQRYKNFTGTSTKSCGHSKNVLVAFCVSWDCSSFILLNKELSIIINIITTEYSMHDYHIREHQTTSEIWQIP